MKRQHPSEGKYQVFYARSPLALLGGTAPTVADLPHTHVFVRALQATDLESVYWAMQGENWSPKGEARPLIERLGLSHTSLSLGDVVQAPDGRHHVCRWSGWEELPEGASKDEETARTMFTTAEEAHQATLQAWETILRGHGEVTPSLQIAIKAYLDLAYFPETALAAVAIYQGRTLCRTRRGRITLLRAPHKEEPSPLQATCLRYLKAVQQQGEVTQKPRQLSMCLW